MLRKLMCCTLFLIASCGLASAQVVQDLAPTEGAGNEVQWTKRINNTVVGSTIKAMQGTPDSGLIFAGYTSGGSTSGDFWVGKLSDAPTITWEFRYGGTSAETPLALTLTPDGGYAVVGTSNSFSTPSSPWVIKLGSDGTLQWQRSINGGAAFEELNSIAVTGDGGLILAGTTANMSGSNDIWLVKLDASGGTVWQKTYGTSASESGRAVAVDKLGAIIVAGDGGTNSDIIVFKVDPAGTILWQSGFAGTNFGFGNQTDRAYSMDVFDDGGFVVAGDTRRPGMSTASDVVVRFDTDGTSNWRAYLGSPTENGDKGMRINTTADGGYVFGAWLSGNSAWVVRGSPGGDVIESDCTAVQVDHSSYGPGAVTLTATSVSASVITTSATQLAATSTLVTGSLTTTSRCEGASAWSRSYAGFSTFQAAARTVDGGAAFAANPNSSYTYVTKLAPPRILPERVIYGRDPGVRLGGNVNITQGNFDKEGLPDLLVGAASADGPNNARTDCGEAYLITEPSKRDRDLRRTGDSLTRFIGASSGDALGFATAGGDLDGDGSPDMILGVPGRDTGGTNAGEVEVFPPGSTPLGDVDLATVSPKIRIIGTVPGGALGSSLAVGDLNNDGAPDLVIGAPADAASPGRVYVFKSPLAAGTYSTVDAYVTVLGRDNGDALGTLVAVGNVNGTAGAQDLIMSATGADGVGNATSNAGEVYVLFGGSLPGTYDLATTAPNYEIIGGHANDQLGNGLAVGDVDGDSIADIAIGASFADAAGRTDAGAVYVQFGSASLSGTLNLATMSATIQIVGGRAGDNLGSGIAIGEVNHRAPLDLILGAPGGDGPTGTRADAGEVDVLLSPLPLASVDLNTYRPSIAFHGVDVSDRLGSWVAVGDVNVDGIPDILMAANGGSGPNDGRTNAGEVVAVYGYCTPTATVCSSSRRSRTTFSVEIDSSCGIDACQVDTKSDTPTLYATGGAEGAYCAIDGGSGPGAVCAFDTNGNGIREGLFIFDAACVANITQGTAPFFNYEFMMKSPGAYPTKILLPTTGNSLSCSEPPE